MTEVEETEMSASGGDADDAKSVMTERSAHTAVSGDGGSDGGRDGDGSAGGRGALTDGDGSDGGGDGDGSDDGGASAKTGGGGGDGGGDDDAKTQRTDGGKSEVSGAETEGSGTTQTTKSKRSRLTKEELEEEAREAAQGGPKFMSLEGELYLPERVFVRKKGMMMNVESGRTWSAMVELIERGPLYLLRFTDVRINNPSNSRLKVYLTKKERPEQLKRWDKHATVLDLEITRNKDGFCHKVPKDGFQQPLRQEHLVAQRGPVNKAMDIVSVCVAKPADQKPLSTDPSMYGWVTLQDVPEDWAHDIDVEDRIDELKERIEASLPSAKHKSGVADCSYKELKSVARDMFEARGKTKDENINFQDWLVFLRTLNIVLTEAKRTELFRAGDPGRTGEIDVIEFQFLLFVSNFVFKQRYMTPYDMFFMIDEREVGMVDEVEFYAVMRAAGTSVDEARVRQVFREVDTEGRRLINFDQFLTMWTRFCDVNSELRRRGKEVMIYWRKKKMERENLENLQAAVKEEAAIIAKAFADAVKLGLETRKKERRARDERHRAREALRRIDPRLAREKMAEKNRKIREDQKRQREFERATQAEETQLKNQVTKHEENRQRVIKQQYKEKVAQQERDDDELRLENAWDRIILRNENLRHFPAEYHKGAKAQGRLSRLVLLDVAENRLDTIPGRPVMFWLASLEKLDASFNQFKELPPELMSLAACKVFNFRANKLTSLHPDIKHLAAIQVLDVSSNQLTELPEEIAELKTLRSLQIHTNNLELLTEAVCELPNLETFNFDSNKVKRLPRNLGKLHKLKKLTFRNNEVTYFPDECEGLTSLRMLDLVDNKLKRLPPAIKGWKALQRANFSRNHLVVLPEEIGDWKAMLELDLSHNGLLSLPENFGYMRNLQSLTLENNKLAALPASVGLLEELQLVDCTHNKLIKVPVEIGAMKNLRHLNLRYNILTSNALPPTVATLYSLEWLNIEHNGVSTLPKQLSTLNELKYLNIGHNRFEALPHHMEDLATRKLKQLIAPSNSIRRFPVPLCELKLEALDLSANLIERLPGELGDMVTLRHLWLYNNKLQALPITLHRVLPNLITFEAGRNDFEQIPGKFSFERIEEAERLGTRFIPQSKMREVHKRLKKANREKDEAVRRAIEARRLPRGRLLPNDKTDEELEALVYKELHESGDPRVANAKTFADIHLEVDPLPPFGAGVVQPAFVTHGKDAAKKKAMEEDNTLLVHLTRHEKRFKRKERMFYKTELSNGFTDADAAEWTMVQSVFHTEAMQEWEKSGWWHYLGKADLAAFELAMKRRLGTKWDDILLKEVRRFYFNAKRLGVPPEYEEVVGEKNEWRMAQAREATKVRTRRSEGAIETHMQRLEREQRAYSVDFDKAEARYAELQAMNRIKVHDKKVNEMKHLTALMRSVHPKQLKTEGRLAAKKRLQELATLDELRYFQEERTKLLDAEEAVRKRKQKIEDDIRLSRPRLLGDVDAGGRHRV